MLPTEGPSWGYPVDVLGTIGAFCQLLAEKCPGCQKHLRKLTFEHPHEGPGVAASSGEPECYLGMPQKALRGGIGWTFLEPFGRFCQHLAEKCPDCLKDVWKLTFEYPHEGPGVGGEPECYLVMNMLPTKSR